MPLPALQNLQRSPAYQRWCCSTAHFSLHIIVTWLLQLTFVTSATANHSASAACDECSSRHRHEFVSTWPRHTSAERATLATSWAENHVEALSTYASYSRRTSPTIFDRLRIDCFLNWQQTQGKVDWHCGLRSAKNKNQVQTAWFLLLRSGCLEQSCASTTCLSVTLVQCSWAKQCPKYFTLNLDLNWNIHTETKCDRTLISFINWDDKSGLSFARPYYILRES